MKRLIGWLKANKLSTIFIIVFYFLLVILPHEWVGQTINKIFSDMPRDRYNLIILNVFSIILALLFGAFFKKIIKHSENSKLIFCFAVTIFCMVIVNTFLFVINIESVHYVQYAVGAILLFGLIGNYFVVLFVSFLISLLDEGYQYFYLTPDNTNYFDFNDLISDLLGAAFGLLLLKTLSSKEWGDKKKKMKMGFFMPLIIFLFSFIALLQSSYLSIFPSQDKFQLVKEMEDGFWTIVPQKIANPTLAITDYLKKYPDDKNAQKLSKELKTAVRKRNTNFTEISGIKFGQKNEKGESLNYGMLMQELVEDGDVDFSLLVNEVTAKQNEIVHFLRKYWKGGIPKKYLSNKFPEITFHVIQPLEGLIVLSGLFLFYFYCFQSKTEEMN